MAVTGPKRTEFEREANLVEIKDAYLRGDTQMSIAERLGLSQAQISRDLATIQRRWRESALVDINEAKQRELERIDVLEREYWQAWESSKGQQRRGGAFIPRIVTVEQARAMLAQDAPAVVAAGDVERVGDDESNG